MMYSDLLKEHYYGILSGNVPDQDSQEERDNPQDGLRQDPISPILLQSNCWRVKTLQELTQGLASH